MATEKLDLYKEFRDEYVKSKTPAIIAIGPAKYLAVTGKGAPGGDAFHEGISALYGAAYGIKMKKKFAGQDYRVCGLEGFWWNDGPVQDLGATSMNEWNWKLVIRVPDFITKPDLNTAVKEALARGKDASIKNVALETIREGRCLQVLHVGPYADASASVGIMLACAEAAGLEFSGRYHELYLSDPRRVAPEKLKTILRIPVKKKP